MVKEKVISNILKQVELWKNKPYMDKLILCNLIFLGNEYGHEEVCNIIKRSGLIETEFKDILDYHPLYKSGAKSVTDMTAALTKISIIH